MYLIVDNFSRSTIVSHDFGGYLRHQLELRGWNQSMLADKAGILRPTMSRIMNNESTLPDLDTVIAIADTLQVPVIDLVHALGQDPAGDRGPSAAEDAMLRLLRQAPGLQELLAPLADLPAAEAAAARAYLEWLAARVAAGSPGRSIGPDDETPETKP